MSDARLEELLAEFVERRELGERLTPESFAANHADAGGELLQALRRLTATEGMLPSAGEGPPLEVGPYRVIEEIGRGAMGRVYRVVHRERPHAPLALKLLTVGSALDPRTQARFRREGEALQQLSHPGIVRVHDIGRQQGTPYLVMDLVEGAPLADWISAARRRRASAATSGAEGAPGARADLLRLPGEGDGCRRAAVLVAAAARAVEAAHECDLLHRDLKPSNVILRAADGQPVLVDFGLVGGPGDGSLTRTGDVLGTPHFMAPEQARGGSLDRRTDVYALGAILYELLTLSVPHPGADPVRVLDSVQRRPPLRPRRIDSAIPRVLEDIVRRATAHRAARRYESAADLAAVLEAYAGGRSLPKATLSVWGRVEDLWLWHRRRVAVAMIGGLLLLSVVLLVTRRSADRLAERQRELVAATTLHLAGDQVAARAAAERLLRLAPDSPVGRYLTGLPGAPIAANSGAASSGAANSGAADSGVGGDDSFLQELATGERALADRRYDDAVAALRRAVTLRSEALAVATLGIAARGAREYELAERELVSAARMLPNSTRILSELGWAYRAQRKFADAVAAFERALAVDPDDPELWHDLARMCSYANRNEHGLEAVAQAFALGDGSRDRLYSRTKGALLNGLGRTEEAIVILAAVAAESPTIGDLHNLALAYDKADRLLEARDTYRAVLARDPEDLQALLSLANLHSGSDRENCAKCAAMFEAHPELYDPELVEEYALAALAADRGRHRFAEALAGYAKRAGRTERLLARLEELLRDDAADAPLGRLVRARNLLQRDG
ncbi:MAG: protein kinase [Planctomycetota bacterium]